MARATEEAAIEEEEDDLLAGLEADAPPHPNVVAQPGRRAIGTTPPAGVVRSRTVTAHDPFTTSVLAEIARRAQANEAEPARPQVDRSDADFESEEHTPVTSPGFHPR